MVTSSVWAKMLPPLGAVLAIVLTLYRLRRTPNLDEADILRG